MHTWTRRARLLAITAPLSLIASPPLWAQEVDAAASFEPTNGDIIVTAQKRAERINDVPMSITAASGPELKALGVTKPEDLVKIVPGLQVSGTFFGAPVYTLRGMGFYDNSLGARPAVTIYVDEIGLPFASMSRGASLDVERVEVLKGPQGTLFGQNSTGGAINYIAAKPTSNLRYGFDTIIGRFNQGEVGGFVSGPLSDTLSARITVKQEFGNDWQRSYTRDDSLGKRDVLLGRLLLQWQPSDRARFVLNLNGWRDRSDLQATRLTAIIPGFATTKPEIANYPLAPRNNRLADWTPGWNDSRDDKFYQASLRGEYDLTDNLTLTSLTSYAHLDASRDPDIDGTSYIDYQHRYEGRISTFAQEIRLSGKFRNANWIFGANYQHDKSVERSVVYIADSYAGASFAALGFPVLGEAGILGQPRYTTKSVFGNIDYPITDQITVHAGARYTALRGNTRGCAFDPDTDYAWGSAFNIIYGLTGANQIQRGGCSTLLNDGSVGEGSSRLRENNTSWRAGLDWKPANDTLLYVNVSKGFKSGNFPLIGPLAEDQIKPAQQESVLAYEIGAKVSLFDKRIQFNTAAFHYKYRDKQFTGRVVLTPNIFGPVESLINVPKSRVYGAEADVSVRPVDGLTLNGGVTYLDTKVKGPFINYNYRGDLTDFGGNEFPFTSKWQYNLRADYQWAINERLVGFVGVSSRYQGSTYASFGNVPSLKLGSYNLVDLRAGIKGKNDAWTLTIFAQNVGDKFYETSAFSANEVVVHSSGMPRTFGISLSFRGGN